MPSLRPASTIAEQVGELIGRIDLQIALAWILAQRDFLVPIPGSSEPERVAENLAAADLTLTSDDLTAIDTAIGDGPYGARNNEGVKWD